MKYSALTLLGLILISYLIFRTSTVQTWITTKIADKLSEDLNTEITIEGVDISWFMHVVLTGVKVNDLHHNTLLQAGRIEAGLKSYSKKKNSVHLSVVEISDLFFALRTYKGEKELNLNFITEHFTSGDTTSSPMRFGIDNIKIKSSRFVLDNENEKRTGRGMDYNHLDVSNINIQIRNFVTDTGYFTARIDTIALRDTCGFRLDNLAGDLELGPDRLHISGMSLITPTTDVTSDFRMDYSQWADWLDFIKKVRFNTILDSSTVDLNDIVFFAPDMEGMDMRVNTAGTVKGTVENLKLRKFKLSYGKTTSFDGKINLNGLPDIEKAFIDVKINKFVTNNHDLNSIKLPGGNNLELTERLSKLRNISIKGRFTGFYNDFVSNATFKTALGNMSTDILLKPLTDTNAITYNGKIKLDNFNLGTFLGIDEIGNLTLAGEINGEGLDKDAKADINIAIANINFSKYNYRHSRIEGKIENRRITAEVFSSDSIFNLYTKGIYDFSDSLPLYKFFADVKNARVGRLFLSDSDTFGNISGKLYVDATGDNVDNITGDIFIDSLYYYQRGTTYKGDSLRITSALEDSIRNIVLRSKFIDGDIEGVFKFADLSNIYVYLLNNFMPAFLKGEKYSDINIEESINAAEKQHFSFDFRFKDTEALLNILMPKMRLAGNTRLNGSFDAQKSTLTADLTSSSIKYENKTISDFDLNINSHLDTFNIIAGAGNFKISDSVEVDSIVFTPVIYRDSIQLLFSFGKQNDSLHSMKLIAGLHLLGPEDITASVTKLDLLFRNKLWSIENSNSLIYKYHNIKVNDFKISSGKDNMSINGSLTDNSADKMEVSFNNFDISVFNFIFSKYSTNLSGKMTGDFEFGNIWDQPDFLSEFKISDFVFNNSPLGNALINAIWTEARNAVAVDLKFENNDEYIPLKFLNLTGFFYPGRPDENLDINVELKQFPLESLKPYLTSFSSNIEGKADGKLKINGKLNEPLLTGKLLTDIKTLKIDYLNTSFALRDYLVFTKDYFGFENAKLFDKKYVSGANSHYGDLTFRLHHNNFDDLRMELSIKAKGLEMLNTTKKDNDIFYGYAVGNGDVKINGPFENLDFDINLTPLKGSKISIPMSETAEVQNAEFITFVVKDSTLLKNKKKEKTNDNFTMSMNMQFNMTPEATVQLVMDETVGDIITANGKGTIRIVVDKHMNVNMYGSYEITKGDYLFTMRNIINKHFYLKPGGTIVWDGDILDARINMSAVYRTEAKLYTLLQMIDTTNAAYKRPSKVDCIINIKGILASPNITFDIDLPEENNATKELVNMVLYASSGETNQDIMNKNFISLLMLGSFQAPSGYSQVTNPNAIASNATELLANQVGTWLNKMSNDVDIGLSWDAGDELTSQEIAVSLSYQAFNDRLLIDGKFGKGGELRNSDNSTRIVGDFNIEYKITKDGRVRARVFNRTNYDDPLTRKAPYTQGAGIVYRKEFDSLKELFEKAKKAEAVQEEPKEKKKKKAAKEEKKG